MCFKAKVPSHQWIVDSGCTKHMTGDETKFISLEKKKGGRVTFGDNNTLNIIGRGKIGNKKFTIDKVNLVKGLKYNLISVSQLLDRGHSVVFSKNICTISHVA